jgi:ribosomal protein L24E
MESPIKGSTRACRACYNSLNARLVDRLSNQSRVTRGNGNALQAALQEATAPKGHTGSRQHADSHLLSDQPAPPKLLPLPAGMVSNMCKWLLAMASPGSCMMTPFMMYVLNNTKCMHVHALNCRRRSMIKRKPRQLSHSRKQSPLRSSRSHWPQVSQAW